MSKIISSAIKILLFIILICGIGVGVWQFNRYYVISKRSTLKSQKNKIISEMKSEIKKLEKEKKSLEADRDLAKGGQDYCLEQLADTSRQLVEAKRSISSTNSQLRSSSCYWIGDYFNCTYR